MSQSKWPSATTLFLRGWGLRRARQMPAEELDRRVKALNLTDEQREEFAEELGATPELLQAWMTGTIPIPRSSTESIEAAIDARPRREALRDSGLPECDWLSAAEQRLAASADEEEFRKVTPILELILEHLTTCPTCLARARFLEERFGPDPDAPKPKRPKRWWDREFYPLSLGPLPAWVPRWAREGAEGVRYSLATVAASMLFVGLPLVVFVPALRAPLLPALPTILIGALVLAAASGLAGLALTFVRRKFDDDTIGRGISGTAGVLTFGAVWVAAAQLIWHSNPFDGPFTVKGVIQALVAIMGAGPALGLVAGRSEDREAANEIVRELSQLSAELPKPEAPQ